jgi:hypothetical protein
MTLMPAHRLFPLAVFSAATLVLASWTRGTASLRCFPNDRSWLQADTPGWVVAVASGDSAIAGTWERPAWWDSTGQPPGPKRLEVYGQWARIERSSEPRDVGRRALFVWWSTGGLCEPAPSRRALGRPAGTRFFAGGSLRERNRSGTAIHDIGFFTPTYVARQVAGDSSPALTSEEYATFYSAMPSLAEWVADPVTFIRRIRAWARANQALASREPLVSTFESMETDYAIRMENRRQKGAWPGDSLVQEPGSQLRAGMQLLYKGDADQLWTIDSLTSDTTLGGVPHCVRMRLRTSAQGSSSTRAFCARAGVLQTYDAATGQLRPARPLLPGSRLTTTAANGSTSVFVTDSLFVELAGGRAWDIVGTTVTTSDSAGRVVRRLREHFAPAILTATEGVFEVPDSTQPGGWRAVTRFRLDEIRRGRVR